MQLDIEFFAAEERVVKFGFLIGINVIGWADAFKRGENPTENTKLIKSCCEKAWLVGTGILMSKSNELVSPAIVLPSINIDSFIKDLRFIVNDR